MYSLGKNLIALGASSFGMVLLIIKKIYIGQLEEYLFAKGDEGIGGLRLTHYE
jgi:hypothetical protein